MARERSVDVLVIGGGPAGSAAAAALARSGIEVVVLDGSGSDPLVRGELVAPAGVAALSSLGVAEQVRTLATTVAAKGTTISSRDGKRSHLVTFSGDAQRPADGLLVDRIDFDRTLRAHAAASGAEILHGWRATHLHWDGNRLAAVRAVATGGGEMQIAARAVLDASGRQAFVANRMGWCFPLPNLGHRVTSTLMPARQPDAGQTSTPRIVWVDSGWLWCVPLGDGRVSIAGVLAPGHVAGDSGDWLGRAIAGSPALDDLVDPATFTSAHPFVAVCQRVITLTGNGFCLLGDAAGFFDPFFATGLVVALESGVSAAVDIRDALHGRGRLERDDFAPTVALVRTIHRHAFRVTRALGNRAFRRWLTAPPPLALVRSGLASFLSGDISRPGRAARLLGVRLLIWLGVLARARPRLRARIERGRSGPTA